MPNGNRQVYKKSHICKPVLLLEEEVEFVVLFTLLFVTQHGVGLAQILEDVLQRNKAFISIKALTGNKFM